MNNKIDDILFSLIQARENIMNNIKINKNEDSYKNLVNGLDNLITDYTVNNKMTSKEILDCAVSIYGRDNKSLLDQIKNLRPRKIVKNLKNKVNEYHKKKELINKYEDEIVIMIKDKLKVMINDDNIVKENNIKENITKDNLTQVSTKIINNKIISINDKKISSKNEKEKKNFNKIPIFDKDTAKIIDPVKAGTFIYKDDKNYYVYRKSDNKNIEEGKENLVKFSSLNQAIVYAIDNKISQKEIKENFSKHKSNYGNLSNYVSDKRGINNEYNNINIINMNNKKDKTI